MLNRRSFLSSATSLTVACTGLTIVPNALSGAGPLRQTAAGIPLDPATRASRTVWLERHAAVVRSIELADDDFSDLEPFAKAVGDARIVMLGEATHGDGATFEAKSRLVRFLHERLGFDVLAFESGLYDMRKAWERLRGGEEVRTAVRRGLFGIWSMSEQVQPLIDYVGERARSSRPLELAGFDTYVTGSASGEFLIDDFVAFLTSHNVDTRSIADWESFRSVLSKIVDLDIRNWKLSVEELRVAQSSINALDARITVLDADAAFWRQCLKSLEAYAKLRFHIDPDRFPLPAADISARDAAMADNLIWLVRHAYPRRKIIVWAATFHNMRNSHLIDGSTPDLPCSDVTTTGHLAWQALGDSIFNVGFTAYEGEHGWAWRRPKPLPPRAAGSLEDLWGATTQDISFLDLRRIPAGGEWLEAPSVSCSLMDHELFLTADWSKILDAVVFIRKMRPSTLVASKDAQRLMPSMNLLGVR
jgi:erythromycin esterase